MKQSGDPELLKWIGNFVICLVCYVLLSMGYEAIKQVFYPQTTLLLSSRGIIFVIACVFCVALSTLGYFYYYKVSTQRIRYFRVVPHIKGVTNNETATRLAKVFVHLERSPFQILTRGPVWFRFLIYMNEGKEIQLFIGCPEDKESGVKSAIKDAYPKAELFAMDLQEMPLPSGEQMGYGGTFRYESRKRVGLPFKSFDESGLGNSLFYMGSRTWIDLQFSPTKYWRLQRQMDRAVNRVKGNQYELFHITGDDQEDDRKLRDLEPDVFNQRKSVYKRYSGQENVFQMSLHLWSENSHSDAVVQSIHSKMKSTVKAQNGIQLSRLMICKRLRNRICYVVPFPFRIGSIIMTTDELANLFHLPDGSHPIYTAPEHSEEMTRGQIMPIYEGQEMISEEEFAEGLPIGTLIHPVRKGRVIRIPYQNLTEMCFGAGKTGLGKSTFLLHALFNYLNEEWYDNPHARGFTYVDAKGKDYIKIIAKLLKDEQEKKKVDWSRIHVFDFTSTHTVPGLNLLHRNPGEMASAVVENALDVLKNAFPDRESIWLDRLGKLALLSLLENGGEHSILGLDQMMRKNALFRKRILSTLKSELKQDWEEVKKDVESPQVSVPIFNRTQKIRYNQRLKRLFGQSNMDLQIQKWFDEGHIVLFNLAGLTNEERKMIMGFIVTQYHQQSMIRSNTKEHFHMVDEFGLVQLPIVKQILSMGRASGHCFIAMTQYADQLDDDIAKAFYGNVGTIIAVRQGFKSAETLQKMAGGTLDAKSIQHLPRFRAAVHTLNNKGTSNTLYVQTKPIPLYKSNGQMAYFGSDKERQKEEEKEATNWINKKVEELMARDCQKVEDVDKWINDYLQMDTVFQETKKQEENKAESLSNQDLSDDDDEDLIFT